MTDRALISAAELNELVGSPAVTIIDCRYFFANKNKGRADWLQGHVPGAAYAHLDHDLSAPITAGTGRHPLPDPDRFAAFLAAAGWEPGMELVAYDSGSNAIAGRLWWLMRYFGHSAALLDGGLAAWLRADFKLEPGEPRLQPKVPVRLEAWPAETVGSDLLASQLDEWLIIDARSEQRFSGAEENLDTVAGHIPGSLNRPFEQNLGPDGRFKSERQLRAEYEELLVAAGGRPVVHSCGSGVTACHNLFAMELAGMDPGRLYAGSWSEWIRDPNRPVATGD
jgi:thiosulfate/3-mercaptopyruvate sulfurtransferase